MAGATGMPPFSLPFLFSFFEVRLFLSPLFHEACFFLRSFQQDNCRIQIMR